MSKSTRQLLAQNFLYNRRLVAQLVAKSSICLEDVVVEIGPGKGIITRELVKRAGHVIAVEVDQHWYTYLTKRIKNDSFELHRGDFLDIEVPEGEYKVFANVPFRIESKIVKRLLGFRNPPADTYLILDRRYASRLGGRRPNLYSTLYEPWFQFSIEHRFDRNDFRPNPDVNPVLWRSRRREKPLLPWEKRFDYQLLVRIGFGKGAAVRSNLRSTILPELVDKALCELSISFKAKPGNLSFQEWVWLFKKLH
jgi:23S rRNA (adenine-N6)-dimethyltransferase